MIIHILKIMYNSKWRNILIIVELAALFFILATVSVKIGLSIQRRIEHNGYNSRNVFVIQKYYKDDGVKLREIFEDIKKSKMVNCASIFGGAMPQTWLFNRSKVECNDLKKSISVLKSDENLPNTIPFILKSGRWYNRTDLNKKVMPALVCPMTIEEIFPNEKNVIGKKFKIDDKDFKVIGTIDYVKTFDIIRRQPFIIALSPSEGNQILVNVKEKYNIDFLPFVHDILRKKGAENSVHKMFYLEDFNEMRNEDDEENYLSFLLIFGVLFLNVVLGLVGVFWYDINLRKSEIALKMALGASRKKIMKWHMAEAFILSLTSILLTIGFSLRVVFWKGKLGVTPGLAFVNYSIVTIIFVGLVMLATWIPAMAASKVQPASALHND